MRPRRPRTRRSVAFSLIELMIAMMFLVIAFFGYVALHARILHSGQRLEEREKIRSATDFYSGMLVARAILGMQSGPDGKSYTLVPELPGVFNIDTTKPLHLDWLKENVLMPKEFAVGMEETMQLSPQIRSQPYTYSWDKR